MQKFGLDMYFGVIQNLTAAIFETLTCHNFPRGQSLKFSENGKNLNFETLKNCEKSKFQKLPQCDLVSPQNVSPDQISASTDL